MFVVFPPDLIGFLAATLTTISFIPQAWKVIKTNDTEAISFGMYATFVTGVFFWLIYGIVLMQMPIIVANTITIILSGFILYKKALDIRRRKE